MLLAMLLPIGASLGMNNVLVRATHWVDVARTIDPYDIFQIS